MDGHGFDPEVAMTGLVHNPGPVAKHVGNHRKSWYQTVLYSNKRILTIWGQCTSNQKLKICFRCLSAKQSRVKLCPCRISVWFWRTELNSVSVDDSLLSVQFAVDFVPYFRTVSHQDKELRDFISNFKSHLRISNQQIVAEIQHWYKQRLGMVKFEQRQ